ncbi:hypothetical protein PGO_092450 [Plasmodium gonderi]|uniref:CRAL-TRIO domain-containing protein n=1 Tax=Plasmodium gonderi TaxID=77519 RepID=A0A1Y1JI53_PLAGO|nr:hypothetical protein PGO_092450 [Plasmodium gonderi]GAW81045.1 hypothetical protein PGO_092450 [Plasmodium gonderi]
MSNCKTESQYISQKALAYEPSKEEIKFYHKNNHKSLRYIFCRQELDDFEKEKIQELKDFVNNLKKKENEGKGKEETYEGIFKNTIFEDDNYVLRFLQGNEFHFEKCYYDMLRHLEWRDENLPVLYDDIKDLLKDVLRVAYYWMEFIISNLFIEGKIEQWRVIIDLSSCGVLNIPIGTLKDISKCLSCNYRSRLAKMLILSAPLFVTGMWHMLKSIIPVVTQQKITISSAGIDKRLLEQVDADQLEKKFGGKCENATTFSKPIMP